MEREIVILSPNEEEAWHHIIDTMLINSVDWRFIELNKVYARKGIKSINWIYEFEITL